MLRIYHMPRSRSSRPIWAAEELGVPYELVIKKRSALKLPDFLAINPLGGAPAIQDGELTMSESCAIVQYLVDRYDAEHRISPPATSPERGTYLQWLHLPEATLWPLLWSYITASGLWIGTPPNAPAMEMAAERITSLLNHIDNTLHAHPYIAGPRFTAADISLWWILNIGKFARALDDSETKNVQEYMARLLERPGLKKAMAVPEGWENEPPGSVKTPPIERIS